MSRYLSAVFLWDLNSVLTVGFSYQSMNVWCFSSLMGQTWEEWLIAQSAVQPLREAQQFGEMGREELSEIQERQMQGPAPWEQ